MAYKTLFVILVFILFVKCKQHETPAVIIDDTKEFSRTPHKEHYLDSVHNHLLERPNDSSTRTWLLKTAYRYEKDNLFKKSHSSLDKSLRLAALAADTLHQARTYRYMADLYDKQQMLDSSFYYYVKSERMYALSKKDSINWGRVTLYKAGILYDLGIFSESKIETIKAMQLLKPFDQTKLMYEAHVKMCLNLEELNEYESAAVYYKKLAEILQQLEKEGYSKNKLNRSWLSYYNNIGSYYDKIAEYAKAKKYYEKALGEKHVSEYPKLHGMLLSNFANNLMMTTRNFAAIDSLLERSLKIRSRIGHEQGILASKYYRARFHLMKTDTLAAVREMTDVYQLSKAADSNYDVLNSLKFLSQYDASNRDNFSAIYIKTKDSLDNIDKATRHKFALIEYETDEVIAKNEVLEKRNIYLIGLAAAGFFLASLVYLIHRLTVKNKELAHQRREQGSIQQIHELLLKQQTITEETRDRERQRIAKDLHDAVVNRLFTTRINLELLPSSNEAIKAQLMEELKKTEEQVREISHDMHEHLFHRKQDFAEVLKINIEAQKNAYGTAFKSSIDNTIDWNRFDISQKTQIYLILQELLQNVNKHAQASNCFVAIVQKPEKLIIRVHDDGVGVNTTKTQKGLGLKSIEHRLKTFNGAIVLETKDQFTIASVEIPSNFNAVQ